VLAIITSTTIALRQSRLTHHANLLPILTEIFDEFRASEFKQHMAYVTGELWRQHPPGAIGFDDLSDSARRHAGTVTSYFNTVGILVANRIISDLLVASYTGRSPSCRRGGTWNRTFEANEGCGTTTAGTCSSRTLPR
jgi:hypothetical protein